MTRVCFRVLKSPGHGLRHVKQIPRSRSKSCTGHHVFGVAYGTQVRDENGDAIVEDAVGQQPRPHSKPVGRGNGSGHSSERSLGGRGSRGDRGGDAAHRPRPSPRGSNHNHNQSSHGGQQGGQRGVQRAPAPPVHSGRYMVPTELGVAMYECFQVGGSVLADTRLRARMEVEITNVAEGLASQTAAAMPH